jgi:hypothetical protein
VALLLQLDVSPLNAQVALIDVTWQDYPQWETGEEEWVACRSPSLVSPDRPPYPGFVVATRGDLEPDGPREVQVEVWSGDEPTGLRCVHENILWVANHGVFVGNDEGHMAKLMLAGGEYALRVLVDADGPDDVSRVVFALGQHRPIRFGNA